MCVPTLHTTVYVDADDTGCYVREVAGVTSEVFTISQPTYIQFGSVFSSRGAADSDPEHSNCLSDDKI